MHFLTHFMFFYVARAAPLLQVDEAATVIPDQYIIKLKHNEAATATSAIASLKQSLSTVPKFNYALPGFQGFAGTLSAADLADLQASDLVEYIQPDVKMHAYILVYQKPATWGLSRITHPHAGEQTYVFDDSAGEGTCAYVVDSGIYVDHPDFEGRATHLANFSDEESDEDGQGHGTHVAGTIGSRTYGVAKKTRLFAVKVLDSRGVGENSAVIAGIQFVIRDAPQRDCPKGVVANMSLGGNRNAATNDAVAAAVASGIFFAVAAGNEGQDVRYSSPASEPTVCTVGATAINDTMPEWSNNGPGVDVLAPGVTITSLNSDGGTATHEGTSMASPHVAGLAAYLLGLGRVGTQGLCETIAEMGVQGVISDVVEGTVNLLINNGALSGDASKLKRNGFML